MDLSALRRPGAVRRWAIVAAGVAVLCALPAIVAAIPASPSRRPVPALLDQARGSAATPYEGLAQSSGRLDLPDVGALTDQTNLLSDTSTLRIWWDGPARHRIDTLSTAGEKDVYQDGNARWQWDSGQRQALSREGSAPFPQPEADDVTPPALARRLLAQIRPDQARPAPSRRVAGRDALGLVVEPRDSRSLVGRVGVWVDVGSGLPLSVEVTPVGGGRPAFRTAFLDVGLGRPAAARLAFQPDRDPTATVEDDTRPDAGQRPVMRMPGGLAGLRKRSDPRPYVATYGDGVALVSVVPVQLDTALTIRRRLDAPPARPPARGPYGEGSLVTVPLLSGLVLGAGDRGWLLAGSVTPPVLEQMATVLVRTPPPGAP